MWFKNPKVKRVLCLLAIILILTGCTANLDKDGNLLPERVIDNNTRWSIDQGWFDFLIVMPIAKLILWFEGYIGILGAIIVVTVITNLITLPFMVRSTVMSNRLQALQPQIDRINRKYRGRNDEASKMRMSAEMNNLYRKNNIKVGQTMILPFLSMPIMIAMWQAVQRIPSVYEATMFGMNLGEKPMHMITSGHFDYLILIIVMALLNWLVAEVPNYLQKKAPHYRPPANKGTSMKLMNIYMEVLIVIFSLNMPTAMSVYWITTSVIGILRSVFIHYRYTLKQE